MRVVFTGSWGRFGSRFPQNHHKKRPVSFNKGYLPHYDITFLYPFNRYRTKNISSLECSLLNFIFRAKHVSPLWGCLFIKDMGETCFAPTFSFVHSLPLTSYLLPHYLITAFPQYTRLSTSKSPGSTQPAFRSSPAIYRL